MWFKIAPFLYSATAFVVAYLLLPKEWKSFARKILTVVTLEIFSRKKSIEAEREYQSKTSQKK